MRVSTSILQLFKEYPVGGVILFRENLSGSIEEILQLTDSLQENSQFGRFIGIDQEGGIINRIRVATRMPGNMALGAINNLELTTQAASIIASELNALGINLNFAPCVDVNSNPQNPVIGVRSFGQNPQLVARHGCAYIDGLNQQQVIACAKHFPGHGNTNNDSHLGEVIVNSTFDYLEQYDLIPFQAAIAHGVDMVMAAHIVAPHLDDGRIYSAKSNCEVRIPATFSKKIITGLLRQKLGFSGVIVSDALDMQAITKNFDPVEATILSLQAGIDLVVMPFQIRNSDDIKKFIDYFNQVYAICESSPQLMLHIQQACSRIIKLKQLKITSPKNFLSVKSRTLFKQRTDEVKQIVGSSKHRQFECDIAKQAITLYKNSTKTFPWLSNRQDQILVISTNSSIADSSKTILNDLHYTNVNTMVLDIADEKDEKSFMHNLWYQIQVADKVLLMTYNLIAPNEMLNNIINQLNGLNKLYVIFSCCNPYDIQYVSGVSTNVLVFGASGFDKTNNLFKKFTLNLTQAITLAFSAVSENQFNHYVPINLDL